MTSSFSGERKHEVVICTYRTKNGHEGAFLKQLARHWPTLKRQGLVAGKPSVIYRGVDKAKQAFFVEIFTWKATGAEKAQEDPAVMQIWNGMGVHMEKRLGRPAMEFPHLRAIRMRFAKI
jgi:hypothetical protein